VVHCFYSQFLQGFYSEGILDFSKAFYESVEIIMWFLSLILFMYYMMSIDLHVLNHSCIPGMKPAWKLYDPFIEFCLQVFY
jgi:hypothetical protein